MECADGVAKHLARVAQACAIVVRFTYWSRTPSMGNCSGALAMLGTFRFAPLALDGEAAAAWVDVAGDFVTN